MSETRSLIGRLLGEPFLASIDRDATRANRNNCALVVRDYIIPTGYKAYILPESIPEEYAKNIASHCPNASILYGVSGTEVLENYDVIEVQETGIVRIVYKDASTDNVLFITNKCNSNCIMCPDADSNRRRDIGARINYLNQLIELIPSDVPHLTITGGEPTLIKWELIKLLEHCRERFGSTEFLMLSNGRSLCVKDYREAFLRAIPQKFRLAVPLYSDVAEKHDAITRSPDSFAQTIQALRELQHHLELEIRIVVMRQNYKDLPSIARFIIQEFPKTQWISIMGMELLGNAAIRRDELWVDYLETAPYIEQAAKELLKAGITTSVYNYPLCGLPRHLWPISMQSITDYKVRYKPECENCLVKNLCGGFFFSTIRYERVHAVPITKETNYGN